jgi:hypothetical protein
MGLNIDTLHELLKSTNLSIDSIDELREFLETVNESEQTPDARKEKLAHRERLQEHKYAHKERLRNLEHTERLRALELGHPLPDRGDVAKAQSVFRAAGAIAILVPLALVCAAGGVSVWILHVTSSSEVSFFGVDSDLRTALFAIVWGVCGLVMLFTIAASLRVVRRAREWLSPHQKLMAARLPIPADQPASSVEPSHSS